MTQQAFVRLVLLSISTLLLSGSLPQSQTVLQQELNALTGRGFTVRWLDNDLVELTDPLSGEKHLKSLREPGEAEIRDWAAARGVPILEIDPSTIDTSKYNGWYVPWVQVPLSNDIGGPMIVSDIDGNGAAECYGAFRDFTSDFESRVYEVSTTGVVTLVHQFIPRRGPARAVVDADRDSLLEITYTLAGVIYDYEQPSSNSLPTAPNFQHDRYWNNWSPGFTGVFFGSLDADSSTDLLYKGSEIDSSDTTRGVSKIYVAEYDSAINNFVRVWSIQYYPGAQSGIGGFVVDDFDGDARVEFVVTSLLDGQVFVTENTGDNNYALTWNDDTPFVNMYYQGAGDIDGDGKPEFFAGATMSNGNWTTMYETDGNNHYTPRVIFHLLSGGTFDEPTYLSADLNNDGRLELVVFSGVDLYVFKSDADDSYYLWYYKRENARDGIQVYDFNADGIKDLIISKTISDGQSEIRFYSDIYLGTPLVSVREDKRPPVWRPRLEQNYPNPFNPVTTIHYEIPRAQAITLKIYTILGQEVMTFIDGWENPGEHAVVWNATRMSSGIYFCRLSSNSYVRTIKLLLIR